MKFYCSSLAFSIHRGHNQIESARRTMAAMERARKYDVQLPIVEQVNAVLFEGKSADQAVKDLMLRDKKIEVPAFPWPEE